MFEKATRLKLRFDTPHGMLVLEDLWEIPLNCMDISQFTYRQLALKESRNSVENLVAEVVKFNGVFSLLWHNHFFDEREYPGIIEHYTGILDLCMHKGMKGITGSEIIRPFAGYREILRSSDVSNRNESA